MMHRLAALRDIGRRYVQVARAAWSERHALAPVPRTDEELAFLPAHLELTETPLSPAPRVSAWIIMGLFCVALLWACLGKLDMVAVAPGQTVTGSRTKVIQPAETAVVHRILVRDGQHVNQGDLLIELDATATTADKHKAQEALLDARLAAVRTAALVDALDANVLPKLANTDGLPAERFDAAQRLAQSEYAAYLDKKQSLEALVAQKQAELHTVESAISPLEQFLAISRSREADYEKLIDKGYVSKQDYMQRKQERLNAERDLAAQRNRREELRSAIASAHEELEATVTEARRQWLDGQRQAREQIRQYEPEVARTTQRDTLMQLRAPVTGTVQQLAVHTVGGVVTPAQPLLAVVPENEPLEVEATVLNQDIGFVRPGQRTTIKVESFPYTRYGYIEGVVESVSHDAIQDEKLGLVYRARVKMEKATLRVDGAVVRLTSGMALTTEIKTGNRRVIDYILDPLRQGVGEAMRER